MFKIRVLDNRKLKIEETGNIIEQDNNVETLEIRVPRLYEGIDLASLELTYLLRLCLKKQLQEIVLTKEVKETEIILTTKLSDTNLYTDGVLEISLCIYNAEIRLNTEIAKLYVKKTLTADEIYSVGIVEEYLEQMRKMVDTLNVEQLKKEIIEGISAEDIQLIEQYNDFMSFPSAGREGVFYLDLTEEEQYVWDKGGYIRVGSDWHKIEIVNGG